VAKPKKAARKTMSERVELVMSRLVLKGIVPFAPKTPEPPTITSSLPRLHEAAWNARAAWRLVDGQEGSDDATRTICKMPPEKLFPRFVKESKKPSVSREKQILGQPSDRLAKRWR
jgi:hypothetical protein